MTKINLVFWILGGCVLLIPYPDFFFYQAEEAQRKLKRQNREDTGIFNLSENLLSLVLVKCCFLLTMMIILGEVEDKCMLSE